MASYYEFFPSFGEPEKRLMTSLHDWIKQDNGLYSRSLASKPSVFFGSEKRRLLDFELPKVWAVFTGFKQIVDYENGLPNHKTDKSVIFNATRTALKAATIARTAFLLTGLQQNVGYDRSVEIVDKELEGFIGQLESKEKALPQYRLLDVPVQEAVNTYQRAEVYGRVQPTAQAVFALGATAVINLSPQLGGSYLMPPHEK